MCDMLVLQPGTERNSFTLTLLAASGGLQHLLGQPEQGQRIGMSLRVVRRIFLGYPGLWTEDDPDELGHDLSALVAGVGNFHQAGPCIYGKDVGVPGDCHSSRIAEGVAKGNTQLQLHRPV